MNKDTCVTHAKSLAPVILFAYNRPTHLERTLTALAANRLAKYTDLTIYSDGPKNGDIDRDAVSQVREVAYSAQGFRSLCVKESEHNRGLANSIIGGVTETVAIHGRVIVLEDDMVTSPWFLDYMNDGLSLYENDPNVASIHGYVYPVKAHLPQTFFLRGADCWGWATWKKGWDVFDADGLRLLQELKHRYLTKQFDFGGTYGYTRMLEGQIAGQNDSWAIRWYASAFLKGMSTLYPGKSFVHNIGNDQTGTHSGKTAVFDTEFNQDYTEIERIAVEESSIAKQAFKKFFQEKKKRSLWASLRNRVTRN
jgi:hypothetical protein